MGILGTTLVVCIFLTLLQAQVPVNQGLEVQATTSGVPSGGAGRDDGALMSPSEVLDMTTQQFLTVPLHLAGALAEDQQVGFSTSSSQLRRRLRGAQAGAYCVARIRRDFRCRWHGQRRRHPNSQDSRDSSSLEHQCYRRDDYRQRRRRRSASLPVSSASPAEQPGFQRQVAWLRSPLSVFGSSIAIVGWSLP